MLIEVSKRKKRSGQQWDKRTNLEAVKSGNIRSLSERLSSMLIELRVNGKQAESDIKRILREEEPLCNFCKYDTAQFCRSRYSEEWCRCHAVWKGWKDNEDK